MAELREECARRGVTPARDKAGTLARLYGAAQPEGSSVTGRASGRLPEGAEPIGAQMPRRSVTVSPALAAPYGKAPEPEAITAAEAAAIMANVPPAVQSRIMQRRIAKRPARGSAGGLLVTTALYATHGFPNRPVVAPAPLPPQQWPHVHAAISVMRAEAAGVTLTRAQQIQWLREGYDATRAAGLLDIPPESRIGETNPMGRNTNPLAEVRGMHPTKLRG
jgi:hypothetical protein